MVRYIYEIKDRDGTKRVCREGLLREFGSEARLQEIEELLRKRLGISECLEEIGEEKKGVVWQDDDFAVGAVEED